MGVFTDGEGAPARSGREGRCLCVSVGSRCIYRGFLCLGGAACLTGVSVSRGGHASIGGPLCLGGLCVSREGCAVDSPRSRPAKRCR